MLTFPQGSAVFLLPEFYIPEPEIDTVTRGTEFSSLVPTSFSAYFISTLSKDKTCLEQIVFYIIYMGIVLV